MCRLDEFLYFKRMKILIAATLKPVNDPRLYEKIALSLAQSGHYEVCIAGYDNGLIPVATKKVKFYPLFKFGRLSFQRVFSPWRIWSLIRREKPDLLVIATHELLLTAFLMKVCFGRKVLYDIQENYFYNILYMGAFPFLIRHLLAFHVRLKEWLFAPFLDGYILAEQVYREQLGFIGRKAIVIENKNRRRGESDEKRPPTASAFRFLYTGTISEAYGIWRALFFVEKLHELEPAASLAIIGYTPDKSLIGRIAMWIKDKPYIQADMRSKPVPYPEIQRLMADGGVPLLPYKANKAIKGKIPTRFWEGLSHQSPMIVERDLGLQNLVRRYGCGLILDFDHFSPERVRRDLREGVFYPEPPGPEIYWDADERRLLDWMDEAL